MTSPNSHLHWKSTSTEDGSVWICEIDTVRVNGAPINLFEAIYRANVYTKYTDPRYFRSVLISKSVANMITIFVEKGGYGDLTLTDYLKKMAGTNGNK